MPSFVFASDSFKGTLSSARVAELLGEEARRAFGDVRVRAVVMADGGEGTAQAVALAAGGRMVGARVTGPRGGAVDASFALLDGGRAVVEMAAASGLPLLGRDLRDPRATSTYGTGELILRALDAGARDITLAIGGSATNDGGMGCMRSLGARFLDSEGRELEGVGGDLGRVARIDVSGLDERVAQTSFSVMCDVDSPLLGEFGATRVFGPQKGATPEVVEELEAGMERYAAVLEQTFEGLDCAEPGSGAAGGLGVASRAFLGASLVSGVERLLDLVGFDELLRDCDVCITGEGHADAQSARGKVVSGVARRCSAAGVPCVAVVGGMDASAQELLGCGVSALVPTIIDVCGIEEALAAAENNYRLAAQRVFSLLRVGANL